MPIPEPVLPEQLLYGHRVGVERATFRITSADTNAVGAVIISGPKRLLWLNVYKTPSSDTGANATFDFDLVSPDTTSMTHIFTGQSIPASGNPGTGTQYTPAPGTAGAENISGQHSVAVLTLSNPDNDSLDLLFEVVYVSPVSDVNTSITSDASIVKMGFS